MVTGVTAALGLQSQVTLNPRERMSRNLIHNLLEDFEIPHGLDLTKAQLHCAMDRTDFYRMPIRVTNVTSFH